MAVLLCGTKENAQWSICAIQCNRFYLTQKRGVLTLMSLVCISPSEAISWCVNTYLSHFDKAFSLGPFTWMALGMTGCKTVPSSKLEDGLWSTHFSPPAERERRCSGRTGVVVYSYQKENSSLKRVGVDIGKIPGKLLYQLQSHPSQNW